MKKIDLETEKAFIDYLVETMKERNLSSLEVTRTFEDEKRLKIKICNSNYFPAQKEPIITSNYSPVSKEEFIGRNMDLYISNIFFKSLKSLWLMGINGPTNPFYPFFCLYSCRHFGLALYHHF